MNTKEQEIYANIEILAEKYGCTLVSKNYINASTQLEFLCPNGHVRLALINTFKLNPTGCRICPRNIDTLNMNKQQQESYDSIVAIAELHGCVVISKNYVNASTHMEFLCPKKHSRKVTSCTFKNNPEGCKLCPVDAFIVARENFIKNIEICGVLLPENTKEILYLLIVYAKIIINVLLVQVI